MLALLRRRALPACWLPLAGLAFAACSSDSGTTPTNTGGVTSAGSGGASTGGTPATGGTVSTGGVSPAGGATSGGMPPTAGAGMAGSAQGGATGGSPSGGAAGGGAGGASGGASAGSGGTAGAEAGGGSGGGGGGAGGATVMLKQPLERSGKYVLEFGDTYFEVDPMVGGRISSARLGGMEVVTGPSVNADNYGSTFWTAPQEPDWGWPPIEEIDSRPYTPTLLAESFSMRGPVVDREDKPAVDGISIEKAFSVDLARNAIVITYTIHNETDAAKTLAPWEITRVGPGGLTFYASETAPTGTSLPPTTMSNGIYWFDYDAATVPADSKLFSDGRGWLAHLTPSGVLLVKSFPDLMAGQAAANEAEIEIYASNPEPAATAYVEVENQGASTSIAAGGAASWVVFWYLRTLPAEVMPAPSTGLADFVWNVVAP